MFKFYWFISKSPEAYKTGCRGFVSANCKAQKPEYLSVAVSIERSLEVLFRQINCDVSAAIFQDVSISVCSLVLKGGRTLVSIDGNYHRMVLNLCVTAGAGEELFNFLAFF